MRSLKSLELTDEMFCHLLSLLGHNGKGVLNEIPKP